MQKVRAALSSRGAAAPAGNYFNCMHLKKVYKKIKEIKNPVKEEAAAAEAKRAFQEDVERQSKQRPAASAILRCSWAGAWGTVVAQVVDAAI